MRKNFIKSERTIYFLLAGIALIISVLIFILFINSVPEYEFTKDREFLEGADFNVISYYEDLDGDGISERIPIGYSKNQGVYFIQFFKLNGDFLEQINFHSEKIYTRKTLHKSWITIADWDGDGYNEIFCPSTKNDTLYMNIISFEKLDFLLRKRPIYIRKNIKKELPWDIEDIRGITLDVNGDGSKDLLLSLGTGFALQPRGFMTYDIKNDSIIDTFFTQVRGTNFTILDIDNDAKEEILCIAGAGGQYPADAPFTDQKRWLFVLNKDLSFKFPPRSYGKIGTAINFLLVNSEIHLLATGVNDSLDAVYEMISNKGKLLQKKVIKKFGTGEIFTIKNIKGKPFFVVSIRNKQTSLFSYDLNLEWQYDGYLKFCFAADLTGDGEKELLFKEFKNYIVTDQTLKKLAEFKLKEISTKPELVSFCKGKRKGIAIQTADKNTIYVLQDSPANKYAIPLFFSIFIVLYLLFILMHFVMKQISIFYHTFLFFIQQDDSSLMLLDGNGKVLRFNKQFENLLLKNKKVKKKHFSEILEGYDDLKNLISKAVRTQSEQQNELSIYKNNFSFKGKLEVIPFRAWGGYTFAYLIKIVDQTEEIINERIQVWSHTAQKIAHEIKTPLASIQLNLSTLKLRLQKGKKDNENINDDIVTINEQINRIKTLTSSLLKITNLEKSHQNVYSLKELLSDALEKFRGYFTEGIKITIAKEIDNVKIKFDKNQFVEVIQIIIENAIDALKGKGEINIYLGENDDSYIELIIQDFGQGIDDRNIQKVFDPYFTSKKEGTGLGLAFAKKITEDNHAFIEIKSQKGEWTKIKLKILKG